MGVGSGLYMYDVVVKRSRSLSHLLMSSCYNVLSPVPVTSTRAVQTHKNGRKQAHPRTPLPRLHNFFFIIAKQPFYGCQRNARKILPLLCQLGFMLRLGSV